MPKSIHREEHQILIRLLREARRDAGLRQSEMAERLGQPQSFVSKYESGERRLDIIELRNICHAIGLTLPSVVAMLEAELNTIENRP
ncbi:MAG: helix-turn-helix transcriptional regulator [Chlorobi bacterium]|nr:MAG: Helix-turn-helix domain protein [Chlorobi bacterium OLB7]MBK8910630.1 helix-turn-helix transcriptional regulator [Chlorobiota bacterium]MBX7216203.1 helix-turn-helix domain-containing protein [Candidatus Kapabacteria bacterium]